MVDPLDRYPEIRDALDEVLATLLPPPTEPMAVARTFVAAFFTHKDGNYTLRHWRGGWWKWQTTHWEEVENRLVREACYRFTEEASYQGKDKLMPWAPNRHKIADLLEALGAVCFLPETTGQPAWINDAADPGGPIVACANGLLHVESRTLLEHGPSFFNLVAVPFDYDPDSLDPARWLGFLEDVFPEDPGSVDALQEFFGYVVSGRLDLQKILLWVGPTRGGKGLTARLLGALVGSQNVAGPTLSSLSTDMGLAPLLGKPLAVVSDARLNGSNSISVVERLLNISGEDTITVNRKYRDQWTGKLPCRFFLISNELPHFGDASGAIVGRFIILNSQNSWLGSEDETLEPALHCELSGVLNWALDGLERLRAQGRFTKPPSHDETVLTMIELTSPAAAFVRDRCERDLGATDRCDELFVLWQVWAEENGHKAGTSQVFGRNLRAVVPSLRTSQVRGEDGKLRRVYHGIRRRTAQ